MKNKKIAVITGSRAEYGLLLPLLTLLKSDKNFSLQLIATGMHLSPEFGLTINAIENDGFNITGKVEMLLSSDTQIGVAKSVGVGIISFSELLSHLTPDIIVVLGDRYEILAATQTALMLNIPVAHIHGGETTEGAIDEAIRHSITKMSHLHFAATKEYKKRIIQLGEQPQYVFNVGALGLDNIKQLPLLFRTELEDTLKFTLDKKIFLITYHPTTLHPEGIQTEITELIIALHNFIGQAKMIITHANADAGGRLINHALEKFANSHPNDIYITKSLGQLRYLSLLKYVDVVIGNSSSGIIEVPFMKKPTINIGDRQKGRISAASIIHCEVNAVSITKAIKKSLSNKFKQKIQNTPSLYGEGNTAKKIIKQLKKIDFHQLTLKKFHDIN